MLEFAGTATTTIIVTTTATTTPTTTATVFISKWLFLNLFAVL